MEPTINILVFGQLEEITGLSTITINRVADTEMLLEHIYAKYPALQQKKFLLAVDQRIIHERTEISEQSQVALLPPFSGG
jgi:molybdopterin converting factor small subunit